MQSKSNEELVTLYRLGNKKALDVLIEKNLGFVYKLAKKYDVSNNNSLAFEDLIQEGNLGLIIAANKYDLKSKNSFITYAYFWIKSKISRAVTYKHTTSEVSLNKLVGSNDKNVELIDLFQATTYNIEDLEECLYLKGLRAELEQIMDIYLTEYEREIIKYYYGWNGERLNCTLIGIIYNKSDMSISYTKNKALNKLRKTKTIRDIYKDMFNKLIDDKFNIPENYVIEIEKALMIYEKIGCS